MEQPIQAAARNLHFDSVTELAVLQAVRVGFLREFIPDGGGEVGGQLAEFHYFCSRDAISR